MRSIFLYMTLIATLLATAIVICNCSTQTTESQGLNSHDASLVTTTPKPANVAEENFANVWKEKFDKSLSDIEANRILWKASGIKDYRFVASKVAGGTTNEWDRLPVVITVKDGIRTSIEKQSKDKDYVIFSRTDGFDEFDTFDKLFDYLRRELESGRIVGAAYDKKLGYPKDVSIVLSYQIHGGRSIKISKFERIK